MHSIAGIASSQALPALKVAIDDEHSSSIETFSAERAWLEAIAGATILQTTLEDAGNTQFFDRDKFGDKVEVGPQDVSACNTIVSQ